MLIVRLALGFVCGVMIWLTAWGCVRTSSDVLYLTQADNGFYKFNVKGHRGAPVNPFLEHVVLAELQIGNGNVRNFELRYYKGVRCRRITSLQEPAARPLRPLPSPHQ